MNQTSWYILGGIALAIIALNWKRISPMFGSLGYSKKDKPFSDQFNSREIDQLRKDKLEMYIEEKEKLENEIYEMTLNNRMKIKEIEMNIEILKKGK